jgi:tRNA(Ile)-lysidine synthase
MLDSGSTVIVGLSGGADSTALLRVLLALEYRCIAVHCNFHLRGAESNRDQQFVTELCQSLGVELIVCSYDTAAYAKQKNISIEMAARELRYTDFERIMQEREANAVCIAHHREDSNETLLLNLIRGTGIKGLTGIKPCNGHIIRPLLCVTRQEVEEWLEKMGQPYVTDSTNLETDYTRNKIRLQLMPLMRSINPSADASLAETARHLQQAYAFYSQAIGQAKEQVVTGTEQEFSIDINKLRQVPSVQGLLFEILSPLGFNDTQISSISESLDSQPGIRFCSDTHQLFKDRDCFMVSPLNKPDTAQFSIDIRNHTTVTLPDGRIISITHAPAGTPISADPCTATLDAAFVTDSQITVRRWKEGDWFIPFGMKGRKLVSDYLTDIKVSQAERRGQLVVTHKDDIIWVVGRRSDNRYRVTSRTLNQIIFKLE